MSVSIESHNIKGILGVDIAASWDLSDKSKILSVIKRCKTDGQLAKAFYDTLKLAAHGYENTLKPKNIGFTLNKMTDSGIQRHGELICMRTDKLFTHFGIGSGSSATTSQTNALDTEIGRADMDSDEGFRVPAGNNIIECGYFDETYPTYTATESGCFDGDGSDPNNEILEWRAVYPVSQQVTHTVNVNFMTYIHTIFARAI
jgi:hypothetical protein